MGLTDKDGVPLEEDRRRYWDQRWAAEGDIFGLEPNRFLVEVLGDMPPGRLLDLGAGQGRNAVWLATRGHTVTAVDLSPVAIERASELAGQVGVSLQGEVADLRVWDPPRQAFDVVVLSYLQVEPALRVRAHAAAAKALAAGGTLFLVAHHSDNLDRGVGGPQVPELLFDESILADDFADLEIDRLEAVTRDVEGSDKQAIDVVLLAHRPSAHSANPVS